MTRAIPNTTQVPNVILDEWLPRLRDTELRVLLIVVRQTFGWIEDKETGRRKERDWISRRQLMHKAGRSHDAIAKAINVLAEYNLIEAFDERGIKLVTPLDREKCGGRIYYRFNTVKPLATLFDTLPKIRRVGEKSRVIHYPSGFQPPVKPDPTKETHFTKDNTLHPVRDAGDNGKDKNGENEPNIETGTPRKPDKPDSRKEPSVHRQFVDFWHRNVQKARGITPVVTGADGKNLKRAFVIADLPTLEKLAVYFLNHPSFRYVSPTISTFLSAGIFNGLQNRMANDSNFWRDLNGYEIAGSQPKARDGPDQERIRQQLAQLKAALTEKLTLKPYGT